MKKMKGFWIHWGMSAVMLFLLAAVAVILQVVKLRTKIPVEVIWQGPMDTVVVYMQKGESAGGCSAGDRMNVEMPGESTIAIVLTEIGEEHNYFRCKAVAENPHLLRQRMNGNTKMDAYVFAGEVKIWNLIFSRKAGGL